MYALKVGGRLGDGTELNVGRLDGGAGESELIRVDGARDLRSISILIIESAVVRVAGRALELRASHGLRGARGRGVVLASTSACRASIGVDQQIRGSSVNLSRKALRRGSEGELNEVPEAS